MTDKAKNPGDIIKEFNNKEKTPIAATPPGTLDTKSTEEIIKNKALDDKAKEDADKAKEDADKTALEQAQKNVQDTINKANTIVNPVKNWIASQPTPGGIFTLIIIIVFFIWAIVPVNGTHTRLELLWLTITGKTHFPDSGTGYNTNTGHVDSEKTTSNNNYTPGSLPTVNSGPSLPSVDIPGLDLLNLLG